MDILRKMKSFEVVQKAVPYIPQSVRDVFRFANARVKYNAGNYKNVQDAFMSRDASVAMKSDIAMLRKLHQIFPIPDRGKYNYDDYMSHVQVGENILDTMKASLSLNGKDLLDVGTGYGGVLVHWKKFGLRSATGVDGPATQVKFQELCRRMNIEESQSMRYIAGDFETLDFEGKQYDIVMSLDSFEHFRHPDEIFRRCASLTRPGGHMFFSFGPLFRAPWGAHRFRYTGVPYIQNMFNDDLVYRFFNDELGVLDEFRDHNNYERDEIAGDPYSEMNRWTVSQFEKLFTGNSAFRIVKLVKLRDFEFWWFRKLASKYMMNCSQPDDMTIDSLNVILEKKRA